MIRINKINIREFDRIKDFAVELEPGKTTLIYGGNESGKTQILDAILDALFSVKELRKHFDGMGRYIELKTGDGKTDEVEELLEYGENIFDGEVELDVDNKIMTFPQNEPLDKTLSIPLIFARNIFAVRDGELNFKSRGNWWSAVKSRLSDSAGDYSEISDKIMDMAGLAPDGKWLETPERDLAAHYENLNKKLVDLKAAKVDSKKLVDLKCKQNELNNKIKRLQNRVELQKGAKKKHILSTAMELLEKYGETQEQTEHLEKFNADNLKIWRNTETEIAKARQIIDLSTKHKDKFAKLADKHLADIEAWTKTIDEWEKLDKDVVPALESKLAVYKQKGSKLQRGSTGGAMAFVWMTLCAVSSIAMTFISYAFNPVFYPVAGVLFVALGFTVKMWWSSKGVGVDLITLEREIKQIFRRLEDGDNDLSFMNNWLLEKRGDYKEKKDAVRLTKEKELPDLENITTELSSSIRTLKNKLKKLEGFTEALESSSGCSSWEELQEKFNKKEALNLNLKMLEEQINQLLNTRDQDEWEDKLTELRPFASIEQEWDEKSDAKLENKIADLTKQAEAVTSTMVEARINIAKLGCRSLEDIWLSEDDIRSELSKLDIDREAAMVAFELLEKASHEHDKLVNNIISNGDGSAASMFSSITGGKYKNVYLLKDTIYADTAEGNTIAIDNLSAGAGAQLFFALRINLAQCLLDKNTAFLLLDEPLLHCDADRRKEMMNILRDIAGKGWQLICFTMDETTLNIFKDNFKDELKVHKLI